MRKKEKRMKKVNGLFGHINLIIRNIILSFYFSLLIVAMILLNPFFVLVTFIIIFLLYYNYLKYTDKFHIRPIKYEELKTYYGKKLIHYTNYLDDDAINNYHLTGNIRLIGNGNAKANYRMKCKDKSKKFVWFHVEDSINKNEPELESFLQSHLFESNPRKYKIVVNFEDVLDFPLFINPVNGNILVYGDANVPGILYKEFVWYTKRLYIKYILKYSFIIFLLYFPLKYHDFIGTMINKRRKR
ncbi:hypothetical protein [Aeribacillus composti]|uniref:hypothetical protein n=1 Tax=Aeribacillus composti TaxID=1868734 RepID=UPI0011AA991A|nr:hypothetical protein [Aeribacillus composti]